MNNLLPGKMPRKRKKKTFAIKSFQYESIKIYSNKEL